MRPDLRHFLDQHSTRKGKFWRCITPGHEDRNPSLSVYIGADGIERARCHSRCENLGDVFECEDLIRGWEKGTAYRNFTGKGTTATQAGRNPDKAGQSRTKPDGARTEPGQDRDARDKNWTPTANRLTAVNGSINGHHPTDREETKPKPVPWEVMERRLEGWEGFEELYLYQDERCVPVLAIARCVVEKDGRRKKQFPQASLVTEGPDAGKWVIGESGLTGPRPLYRLPELLEDKGPVWVVEGEKAANAGAAVGLVVTTASCGSGKAGKTDWTPLRGRTVLVLPDNDDPGRKHAEEVVRLANDAGARARILELPDLPVKGDLFDWIAARKGVAGEKVAAEIRGLARTFPQISFREQRTRTEPPWVVKGVLPVNGLGMIYGPAKAGKSFVVLDLACQASLGNLWHGRRTRAGRWVYICAEGAGHLTRRAQAWYQQNGDEPDVVIIPQPVMFDEEQARLLIDDFRDDPPAVVVVDTLARCMLGDENSTADMGEFIRAAGLVQRSLGCAVLLVHHTGHQDKHRARGSSALVGAVDVGIAIERIGDTKVLLLKCTAAKEAEPFDPIGVELRVVSIVNDRGEETRDEDGDVITSCVALPASREKVEDAIESTASDDERAVARGRGKGRGRPSKIDEARDAVIYALRSGPKSQAELQDVVPVSRESLRKYLIQFVIEGSISVRTLSGVRVYSVDSEGGLE